MSASDTAPTAWCSPIAAIATAGSSATKNRARAASASSCSSTPTRWGRPRRRRMRGVARGQYVVKVNNRKVLDGVRDAIGVTDDGQWLTVMRAIDKLDRLGVAGVQQLLGDGRKDESGDFTKGAGLSRADIVLITSVIEPVDDAEEKDAQLATRLHSKIGEEGRTEL